MNIKMTLDSYLFGNASIDSARAKKHLLGAMAFDRSDGIVYIMERRADEEKSIAHVFKIAPSEGISDGSGDESGTSDDDASDGDDATDGNGDPKGGDTSGDDSDDTSDNGSPGSDSTTDYDDTETGAENQTENGGSGESVLI